MSDSSTPVTAQTIRKPIWPRVRKVLIACGYLLYWAALAATAHLWATGRLPYLPSRSFDLSQRTIMTAGFWFGSLVFWQIALGPKRLAARAFAMLYAIITLPVIPLSALAQAGPRLKSLAARISWKALYALALTLAMTTALVSTEQRALAASGAALWALLALAWLSAARAALRPERLVEGFRAFAELFTESNLKKEELPPIERGLGPLARHARAHEWTTALAGAFGGGRSILLLFVAYFAGSLALTLGVFAALHRVAHLTADPLSTYFVESVSAFLGTHALPLSTLDLGEGASLYFYLAAIVIGAVSFARGGAQSGSDSREKEIAERLELIESCVSDLSNLPGKLDRVESKLGPIGALDSRVTKINDAVTALGSRLNGGLTEIATKLRTVETAATQSQSGQNSLKSDIQAIRSQISQLRADFEVATDSPGLTTSPATSNPTTSQGQGSPTSP